MRINHNIAALNTYRQLSTNTAAGSKSLEKLSSGLRINRAGDDAAGLAISEKMRAQIRGLNQAQRNAQDGISMIQTTEGALNEAHSILQRMRELSAQAANDTNVDVDRQEIQKEINQLTSEVNRIGNTTEFNTQSLLKGKNVAVVETAAAVNTVTGGKAGVAVGTTSNLTVNTESVVGEASTTSVQGSTSKATGEVSDVTETTTSVKGEKAMVTVANGMTFETAALGDTFNGKTISIKAGEGNNVTSSLAVDADGNYTFTIGTNGSGDSLATNRGTLYNEISSAITAAGNNDIKVLVPADTAEVVTNVATTGTLTGGVDETAGVYSFSVENAFEEGGDSVTIDGQKFTAVYGRAADASAGEFRVGANVTGTAALTTAADFDFTTLAGEMTVTIDGTAYTTTGLDATDHGTSTNLLNVIKGAVDGGGNALSTVANIEIGDDGKISISAKEADASITVTFAGGGAATTEERLGITEGSTQLTSQAKQLAAAIEANDVLGARFNAAAVTVGGQITLTETAGQATGVALTDPVVAGSGSNDKLVITNSDGKNLNTVSLKAAETTAAANATATLEGDAGDILTITAGAGVGSRANQVKFALEQNDSNTLNVAYKDGVVTISLANATAANNNAAAIQTAIRNLGTQDGIDFSAFTAVDTAGWDGAQTGAVITDANSQLAGGVDAVALDAMTVTSNGPDLTIHLSGEKASENTAEKIQEAIQDLGEYFYFNEDGDWTSVNYSNYTTKAEGNWDSNTYGNSIIVDEGTFVGGTEEVLGEYEFELTKAFAAGDKVEIGGKVFTAVAEGAVASNGQFNVSGGNINAQAAGLIDAINLSSLKDTYTATANAGVITLTENDATGEDLANEDLAVRATGTQGEYTVDQDELLENGAKFIVDGEEILVTSANAHVGYGDGTAVKVAATVADQSKALADAINKNENLKGKYTASVADDGSLKLTQTADFTTETAPAVSTKNSSIGDFTATFQIGANSGQSMTISVGDMRANALGISGDGSVGTVAANNGAVASYTTVSNVNSGSDNKNVEFALDVTTSEKASAALSVINDAIERVSSQRSQLGAFQNRLEHTINNLGTSSENLVASESRIRDVDMAAEMMEFTKNNILSQAAQSMLAQANQQPQGVLQLLR